MRGLANGGLGRATAGRLREIAFYLAVFLFVGAVTIVVLRYTAAQ